MYFGQNNKFKNLLRLKCSKFSKGVETALKSTYPTRSSKVVFAHDGASMPATGIVFNGGVLQLELKKIEFEYFVLPNCKFCLRHKTGLKSIHRRTHKKYIRFIHRSATVLASSACTILYIVRMHIYNVPIRKELILYNTHVYSL
jgi:hypothetical protein